MKPNPLASLNHLTLPVIRDIRYALLLKTGSLYQSSRNSSTAKARLTKRPGEPMTDRIDTLLKERRTFPPAKAFRDAAHVGSPQVYRKAKANPTKFWAERAAELEWFKPWRKILEWKVPHAKWFLGGKLNASVNCLDRHVKTARRNKVALLWEGEPGDRRAITYWELYREVNRFANVLKGLGVKKGDRVAIYLPMIPEAVVAMQACARIGAPHSVVFGGFSAEA